jgi:hypothetical protein
MDEIETACPLHGYIGDFIPGEDGTDTECNK